MLAGSKGPGFWNLKIEQSRLEIIYKSLMSLSVVGSVMFS